MKSFRYPYAAIMLLSLIFFSCSDYSNLAKPKKISVKTTNQSYSFSAGKGLVNLSDHFNALTLYDNLRENEDSSALSNLEVYDYWPGGSSSGSNLQQFLFHYPVATIPLDFGDYLSKLDLMSELSEALSQTVTIPELGNVGFTQSVSLPDINQIIEDTFAINPVTLPVPEPGSAISLELLPGNPVSLSISAPSFASMDFTQGTLAVTVAKTDSLALAADFELSASIQLCNSSGAVLSTSDTMDLKEGGTLYLPLAGISVLPSMKLRFVGTYSGGNLLSAVVHSYKVTTKVTDVELSKITGLTMSSEDLEAYQVTIDEHEIPMSSLGSYVKSATVGQGGILVYGKLPSGWSGISCSPSLSIADSGSLTVSGFVEKTPPDSDNYLLYRYADLSGQTIDPTQTVTLSGSVELSIDNATITLSGSGVKTVDLVGALSIASVSEAVIDMADLLGNKLDPVSKSQSMGESVTKYVKEVSFNKIGARASVTTDLPAGNLAIGTSITSALFGITDSNPLSDTALLADGSGSLELVTDDSWSCSIVPVDGMEADFTMELWVGSQDSQGNRGTEVTFTNLEFGKDYTLAVDFALEYDWESITLSTGDAITFSGSQKTGLNLQSILESHLEGEQKDMLDQVELSDNLIAYLNITRPTFTSSSDVSADPLESFADLFAAMVALKTYSDVDGETVEDADTYYLLGSAGSRQSINLVETASNLAALADENLLITKDLFTDGNYSAKIAHTEDDSGTTLTIGLADILNGHETNGSHTLPADLEFVYEVGSSQGSDLTLTKAQIEALTADGSSAELSVDLNIVFPLEFTIKDSVDTDGNSLGYGIHIKDVLDLAGKSFEDDEDVFNREDADSKLSENFEKYGSILKQVALSYKLANNTGLDVIGAITLVPDEVTESGETIPALVKLVEIDGDNHTLYLDNDEITRILSAEAYPFQPKISVDIAAGTVAVPRNGKFEAEASIQLIFDGTVTVYDADDED